MEEQNTERKENKAFLKHRAFQIDIALVFATLLISTVLLIVFYTDHEHSRVTLDISQELIDSVANAVMSETTAYMQPAQQLAALTARFGEDDTFSLANTKHLEEYMVRAVTLHSQLAMFYMGDEQGNFLMAVRQADGTISTEFIDRSNPSKKAVKYIRKRNAKGQIIAKETEQDVSYDPRQRPWYRGAKGTRTRYWTDMYVFFTGGKPGITAAYPSLDAQGKLRAVVGADIELGALSTFLGTLQVSERGFAFVLNSRGELVAFPGGNIVKETPDGKKPLHASELDNPTLQAALAARTKATESRFRYSADGLRWMAYFHPLPASFGKDWTIAVLAPEDDFVGPLKATQRVTLGLSLIVLVLAIVIAVFLSRSLSRPIERLTAETNRIRNFDLDGDIRVDSHIREVQLMDDAIFSMKSGLRAFRKYVPDALVRDLIQTGEEARLGGTTRELTIFFSDIADFTSASEQLSPEDLMLQLSDYLNQMTTIILEETGTIDKYIGDSVMAFWGAPRLNERHAACACEAALNCTRALDELNQQRISEGKEAWNTRIGIHTGPTVVGNVGSSERMNYTVLGDSVNVANRLEGVNKLYGTNIIISRETLEAAGDAFITRPIDAVAVKGRQEDTRIYELMGRKDDPDQEALLALATRFDEAFQLYRRHDWAGAELLFAKIAADYPDDTPARIYLERCHEFGQQNPDINGTFILRLDEK